MLASMTIYSTISPFVIDGNTQATTRVLSRWCSPFHQASLPFILLSPFGINDKGYPYVSLHVSSLSSAPSANIMLVPPVIMLCLFPLSWCSFSFISPFVLKGKGNTSWFFHIWPFGEGITPNFCLRYSNVSLGRGLVKMSTICSFVSTYSSLMFFSVTYSLRKWNLMGMCFVLECITRFLDMFITLVLSHNIGIGSSYFTCVSSNVCLI